MKYTCPVCGYDQLEEPPRDKHGKCPSYEICSCCGFEFGYDDDAAGFTYDSFRKDWVKRGCPWRHEGEPTSWDPFKQMAKAGIEVKAKHRKKNVRRGKE